MMVQQETPIEIQIMDHLDGLELKFGGPEETASFNIYKAKISKTSNGRLKYDVVYRTDIINALDPKEEDWLPTKRYDINLLHNNMLKSILDNVVKPKIAELQSLVKLRKKYESGASKLCKQFKDDKDKAYTERNKLVALVSSIYPSHLTKHSEEDKDWERDWMNIVCIHSPAAQLTWHIHDSELHLFKHLKSGENHWDGHLTEEKYDRIQRIINILKDIKDVEIDSNIPLKHHEIVKEAIYQYVIKHPNVETNNILDAFPTAESWQILELLDELQIEGRIK